MRPQTGNLDDSDSMTSALSIGSIGGAIAGGALGSLLGPTGTLCGALLGYVLGREYEARTASLKRRSSTVSDIKRDPSEILIIGCGGFGLNILHKLPEIGGSNVQTVAIDTYRHHLEETNADSKILIGQSLTEGLGTDGDVSVGREAAENAEDDIRDLLGDAGVVFLIAGLGGGTGIGATPTIARIAREEGCKTIGILSTPLHTEVNQSSKVTDGVEAILAETNSTILFDNDYMKEYLAKSPRSVVYAVTDSIIVLTIKALSEVITTGSDDYLSIIDTGGLSTVLVGETEEIDNVQKLVSDAFDRPLMEMDQSSAKGAMVFLISDHRPHKEKLDEVVDQVSERLPSEVQLTSGFIYAKEQAGTRLEVILTGVDTWRYSSRSNTTHQSTFSVNPQDDPDVIE
jgi:cell division protein FtsZ